MVADCSGISWQQLDEKTVHIGATSLLLVLRLHSQAKASQAVGHDWLK
jgi:hypothetical protein